MGLDRQEVLAVDAALLLPPAATERVSRLNALLYAEQPDGFEFGPTRVPHITLAQLYVRRTNLLELIRRLDTVFREAEPLGLSVSRLVGRDQVASLRISKTAALLGLHAMIMDEVKKLSEPDGSEEAFYGADKQAREKDVAYVTGFRRRASYGRYVPHITLGYGTPPVPDVFMDFVCSQAALFQLGRFCTCRQLLHKWKLH
jgi:2'-5' RNA ligase